jgi:hypothetical protein
MERHALLDTSRRSPRGQLILFLLLLFFPFSALAQAQDSAAEKLSEIKSLYEARNWDAVVNATSDSPQSPDLLLYRGLALAHRQRREEARAAFTAGRELAPRDPRFPEELAGIAYQEKDFAVAKSELRRVLALEEHDNYANNFLASIYFQEGNLEAALKYWNRVGKPKLDDLTFQPQPKLQPLLLDSAFAFSPGNEWNREAYLTTQARLDALDVYPRMFFELQAHEDDSFALEFHGTEQTPLGGNKWLEAASLLRDLPFQAVRPEFYNLDHAGRNWISSYRWDDQKRRLFSELAAPLHENPKFRYRLYFEGRNENWNLSNTLSPATSQLARLNLERIASGAEIRFIESGRWQWTAGIEYTYREFRNLQGISAAAAPFFTNGSSVALRSSVQRWLIRFPERRFTLDSSASAELGTFFKDPLGRYGQLEGTLAARWLPKARGDDYETQISLHAGHTIGEVPFDRLFTLGFDRDTPLWLRGHPGLEDGQKGNAPLGRDYLLVNSETDKILYRNGLITLKAGPFLDSGKTYDSSAFFGSPKWLWDTGVETKVKVLGQFQVVLGYGKDLRSGRNSFFTTVTK